MAQILLRPPASRSVIFFPNWLPGKFSRLLLLLALTIIAGCGPRVSIAPSEEVQVMLIQQAQGHFAEGRYETSARILRRLIETYPRSLKLMEARWWLARSYEQAGEFKSALAEYRVLAAVSPSDAPVNYGPEAKNRIALLEQRLGILAVPSRGLVAIQLAANHVPEPADVGSWLQTLSQTGVTMLVLDVGTKPTAARTAGPPGVYFRTNWATVIRDVFGSVVPAAHRQGMAVFASLTLRQMDWLDGQLGWNDAVMDRAGGGLKPSPELDLMNPAFQEYLIGFLAELAATGIDGVLFRAEASSGPGEGFTTAGLQGFEREFGIKLDPGTLPIPAENGGWRGRLSPVKDRLRQELPPEYWKWLGWKARETVDVMTRLRQAIRKRSPVLQFAVEFHPDSVSDPLTALVQYGEDLLEAKTNRFDYYVLATGPTPASYVTVPPPNGPPTVVRPVGTFLDRLVELVGEPERIWIEKPLPLSDPVRPWVGVAPGIDRNTIAPGTGLIYVESPLPIP